MDVKGLAAVVTGGGSGLGAASAHALAAAGAKVAVLDLNGEAAEAVAKEIGGLGLACDVGSAEEAEAAVTAASQAHGPCRVLVNCAGIMPVSPSLEMDDDEWDSVLATNLSGPFYCSQAVLPGMVGRGSGSIVMSLLSSSMPSMVATTSLGKSPAVVPAV